VPGDGEVNEAWSQRLSVAAWELLLTLAALAGDMVIEANFNPHSELEVDRLRGLGDRVVKVHCACPAEVAVARYNARSRNEVHWVKTATLTTMDKYDRPVGIGSLITVDTTVPVDVAFVAAEFRHKACISNHVTVRPPRRRHPHRAARRATRWSPRPSSASLPAGRGSGTLAHSGR
jgi:hypothetical protein